MNHAIDRAAVLRAGPAVRVRIFAAWLEALRLSGAAGSEQAPAREALAYARTLLPAKQADVAEGEGEWISQAIDRVLEAVSADSGRERQDRDLVIFALRGAILGPIPIEATEDEVTRWADALVAEPAEA